MKKHLAYLRYVLVHKWFVLILCCREGIPWRGLTHDLSKFRPSEWFPYVENFFGDRDAPGVKERFQHAWDLHCRRNTHHPRFWQETLTMNHGPATYSAPMPAADVQEMLCDWWASGRTQTGPSYEGWPAALAWYRDNEKMKNSLHPITRAGVEMALMRRVKETT